jgi:hypothetical protein
MAEWEDFSPSGPVTARTSFLCLSPFSSLSFFDLTVAVGAGLVMAAVMFLRQMEEIAHVQLLTPKNAPESEGISSLRGKTVLEGVVLSRFHGPALFRCLGQTRIGSPRQWQEPSRYSLPHTLCPYPGCDRHPGLSRRRPPHVITKLLERASLRIDNSSYFLRQ